MKTFAQYAEKRGLSESETGVAQAAWNAARRGRQLKVFYNTSFKGRWPVGTAALVVAENQATAALMLHDELVKHGIRQPIVHADMVELELTPQAIVLLDGDY